MKEMLKYFSIMIMVLVLSTGCGKEKDADKILEDAAAKMKEIESMSVKMTLDMALESEEMNLSASLIMDADMDKDKDMHGTLKMTFLGISESAELYLTEKDGYNYTYTKADSLGEWELVKEKIEETEENSDLTEDLNEMLESMTDVKEIKSDREGYTKLEVKVDMSKYNDLISQSGMEGEAPELSPDVDMIMNLYIKDGYITIMEVDYADMINQMPTEGEETGIMDFSKAKMTIEISNFNKVDDIVIPESVINNAKLVTE